MPEPLLFNVLQGGCLIVSVHNPPQAEKETFCSLQNRFGEYTSLQMLFIGGVIDVVCSFSLVRLYLPLPHTLPQCERVHSRVFILESQRFTLDLMSILKSKGVHHWVREHYSWYHKKNSLWSSRCSHWSPSQGDVNELIMESHRLTTES